MTVDEPPPRCEHAWVDDDDPHDDQGDHACIRASGHERMHLCRCGACTSPTP